MRIVTCHVPGQLRDETHVALIEHAASRGIPCLLHEIRPDHPKDYQSVLQLYWEEGEDFMVVEPDIVVRADVIDAFQTCSCQYGCFPYPWTTDIGPALGCTWFREDFIARYPDAFNDVVQANVMWNQLDVVLMRHILARQHKEQPHVHLPPVTHLNEAKQLIEGASNVPLMTVPNW